MRYTILGTTQALRDGGTPVTLTGGRLRALLTALALRPGRVIGVDVLIDEVWDGEPPAGATGALQALVGRLRKALGHDAVGSVDGGYRLLAAPDDVDLYRFERLAEEGARALADGDPVKAAGLLGDALALWRGPALADLPDRGTAAVRSEALRLDAQRRRLTAELALGRAAHILPELAELAAAHPLDEPLHALRLRALRATGRTADALAAYEALRRDLADQLGTDPSAELRALHAELLTPEPWSAPAPQWDGAGPAAPGTVLPDPGPAGGRGPATGDGPPGARSGAAGAPGSTAGRRPSAAAPRGPGNARARLTSFVGRESDLAAVREDLARARLVTVTGPGGTGKTRLTQEAGDLVAEWWPDGVWYVELAPVSDPRTLPEAVISALGLRETLLHTGGAAEAAIAAEAKAKDPARRLTDYCASRVLLLVLDNCEHVIDAAATLTEQLLASCPNVSVLATSREPLGVPGELVRPLDPLPDPTALRLLADRGAAARPGFSVDEDPVACAELCRRLDGLPLAIELAAARLRSLSPRQLADRLDDRFRLLTGGSRTLLPRQQTLRAVVDWSWHLLDPAERVLLRRLAVFRGGWTLEAVEAICSDEPGGAHGLPARRDGDGRPPGRDGEGFLSDRRSEGIPSARDGNGLLPGRDGNGLPPRRDGRPTSERIEAPDAAALLSSLVDKSLVLADLTRDGSRYRMLETIAEYAAERLDESGARPAVERRHISYFREYARTADPELRGRRQLVWFERLEREHENLRAALHRAVAAGDEQEALVLVLGCNRFWEVRNYRTERRRWPSAVAAMGPDPFEAPPTLEPVERGPLDDPLPLEGERLLEARRWVRIVDMSAEENETEWWTDPRLSRVGRRLIETYPPHLPQSARSPGVLRAYGAFFSGDFDRLHELIDETVESCRTHGTTWELAYALSLRAKINNDVTERLASSLRDIEESRRLFEQLGDEWGTAETLSAEAEAAANGGDWRRSAVCCREGIVLARKLGSHQQVPVLTVRLGEALINGGEAVEGERLLREGIKDAERFGAASDGAAFYGMVLLASLLGRRGQIAEALEVIDGTIREHERNPGATGVPGFIMGMLRAMQGHLIGKGGDPERGLAMISEGIGELTRHPLAEVITPRMGILLAPGAVELLRMLAEPQPRGAGADRAEADRAGADGVDGAEVDGADGRRMRRARRAVVLAGAHERLRPAVMPPDEARDAARTLARLRELLGDQAYDTAYAEGGGLNTLEAAALMSDAD